MKVDEIDRLQREHIGPSKSTLFLGTYKTFKRPSTKSIPKISAGTYLDNL